MTTQNMKLKLTSLTLLMALTAMAQSPVKVNQVGYYPDGP